LSLKELGSENINRRTGEKAFESFTETETEFQLLYKKDLWDEIF
jgi:hypothetical protein